MCQFCVQHGEGQKWYLAMKNYSRELLEQNNRIDFMAEFVNTFEERMPDQIKRLESITEGPLGGVLKPFLEKNQKKMHYGQVVPVEEVEQIIKNVDNIARLPCVCRRVTTGQKEARYCFALTAHPKLAEMIDKSFSMEFLTKEEAIEAIHKLDEQGLVHTIWTFKTPFIGGLCNCDQDCLAYRICHVRKFFHGMFRAEYVANVEPDSCNGCKDCMKQCQFGAIRFSSTNQKVVIDQRQCWGCGVCRSACPLDAITLNARAENLIAAQIW